MTCTCCDNTLCMVVGCQSCANCYEGVVQASISTNGFNLDGKFAYEHVDEVRRLLRRRTCEHEWANVYYEMIRDYKTCDVPVTECKHCGTFFERDEQ